MHFVYKNVPIECTGESWIDTQTCRCYICWPICDFLYFVFFLLCEKFFSYFVDFVMAWKNVVLALRLRNDKYRLIFTFGCTYTCTPYTGSLFDFSWIASKLKTFMHLDLVQKFHSIVVMFTIHRFCIIGLYWLLTLLSIYQNDLWIRR